MGSALHPESQDDDIVHSFWKQKGKCNQLVVGSNPTPGAIKLDTNSFFEDERVRSPSPANGGAGLRSATASPSLWREMKRILMLSGE